MTDFILTRLQVDPDVTIGELTIGPKPLDMRPTHSTPDSSDAKSGDFEPVGKFIDESTTVWK